MKKVLIVCANYYKEISENLIKDAEKNLINARIKNDKILVPGIFEIPVTISKYIKNYDAFIALGCVIKGQTPHFEFICNATFNAIMNISTSSKKPIGNGIITALDLKQASLRDGGTINLNTKLGKGKEAAKAVISVLNGNIKKNTNA